MNEEILRESFLNWAKNKFGEENIIEKGDEICINSPFATDDRGYHLYCNWRKSLFHCWKSNESGSLYNLIMEIEGCTYPDAQEILGGSQILYNLEEKVAELFAKKKIKENEPVLETTKNLITLPPDTYKITSLSSENRLRILSEKYLTNRKIPIDGLYVCATGKYAMRIVIPYYGPNGQLIYFNARDITNKSKLRYQGPIKEMGLGKGDVIWMKEWPVEGSTIYLTEGEFDAMSLIQSGYHGAAAGGKNFSNKQLQLVKSYNIVIAFDLDKSGLEALNKVGCFIRANQFIRGAKNDKIGYIRPAKGYKDWNDMLVKLGTNVVHLYVKERERFLEWDDIMRLNLNST